MKLYKKSWQAEFDNASRILPKCKIEWVLESYILFRIRSEDFTVVVYPHKTSAGNHHARVRDENSKNKYNAVIAMKKLNKSESNCTFSVKTWPMIDGSQVPENII